MTQEDSEGPLILRPQRWRYLIAFSIGWTASALAIYLVGGSVHPGFVPAGVLGATVAVILLPLHRRWAISITPEVISGPQLWSWHRVSFPRADVDIERTKRRSLLNTLTGACTIWSHDGRAIAVIWLGRAQRQQVLRVLGVEPPPA